MKTKSRVSAQGIDNCIRKATSKHLPCEWLWSDEDWLLFVLGLADRPDGESVRKVTLSLFAEVGENTATIQIKWPLIEIRKLFAEGNTEHFYTWLYSAANKAAQSLAEVVRQHNGEVV